MNKRFIMSRQGHLALQKRITQLERENLSLATELGLARLDGDISENADFLLLREKMDHLSQQIFNLRNFLEKAEVREKNTTNSQIEIGNTINYQLIGDKKELTIELANEIEADPSQGKISVTSPLGSSLIGKKVGDTVEIKQERNQYKIQILAIK